MSTGKGMPDKVKWGEDQETAFQKLKQCLSQPPVLRLPDFNKLFILKVDASETGLGAALMQNFDGGEFRLRMPAENCCLERGIMQLLRRNAWL